MIAFKLKILFTRLVLLKAKTPTQRQGVENLVQMKIKGTYKHNKDFYKQKKMRKEERTKDQRKTQIFIKVVFAHRFYWRRMRNRLSL